MTIQPIVEGHGEVAALPVVLRRLRDLAQIHPFEVNPPIRRHHSDFFDEVKLRSAVRLAVKQDCGAVLILVDGDRDGDCPREQTPQILNWARCEASTKPCAVVMAYREYEAWFLASIESLRGQRGIRADAISHSEPEKPRGAKEELEACMHESRSYHETADQAAFSAVFDMQAAYAKCRSFRHFVKVFGELTATGKPPGVVWPPAEWRCE